MDYTAQYNSYQHQLLQELLLDFESLRDFVLYYLHKLNPAAHSDQHDYLQALDQEKLLKSLKDQQTAQRTQLQMRFSQLLIQGEGERQRLKQLQSQTRRRQQRIMQKQQLLKEREQLKQAFMEQLKKN